MKLKRPMYGSASDKGPTIGGDVLVLKNGLWRHPAVDFPRPKGGFDNRYNVKTAAAVKRLQRLWGIKDTGDTGQKTWDEVWPYVDPNRRADYRSFKLPVEDVGDPPLIAPRQGFGSLVAGLHLAFAVGRGKYGLLDGGPGGLSSGTFNPASRLPSGAPSSHAKGPPARAFDLDLGPEVSDDTGWKNLNARAYAIELVERDDELNIGYVILGDRIWSKRRAGEGWRKYTGGGHLNHVHVNYEID